jgi:LmbE family N-acetylglucosaminyl deacetylase
MLVWAEDSVRPPADVGWQPKPAQKPADGKLRIIGFGAHPDDCEIKMGGAAVLWSQAGHHVKFVSTCNGDLGHTQMAGGPLAQRRKAEVEAAAGILGIAATQVLDNHDAELMPTLENRRTVTRLIRQWNADVVLCHRTNDYMCDHRYTGVLVEDSAFLVTVPYWCPDTPYLPDNPVFLFFEDRFEKPSPFEADVVVSIDSVIDRKLDALVAIESQFVEGGCGAKPGSLPKTPEEREQRRRQARERFEKRFAATADRFRDKLIELYGQGRGRKVRYAEAFEVCQFGRKPTPEQLIELFPFSP